MSASGTIFTYQQGALVKGEVKAAPPAEGPIPATGIIVDIDVNIGLLGVAVEITGTYVGTLAVETSLDARNSWQQIDTIISQQVTKVYPFLQTAPSIVTDFRIRGTMWTSGIANVQIIPWIPPSVPTIVGSGNQQQLVHAPDKFKIAAANAAGNTPVWTPAPLKQFRVLHLRIQPTAEASISSAPGNGISMVVDLLDGLTSMNLSVSFWIPKNIPASPTNYVPFEMDLGPIGYLSQSDGNVLSVNLPQALTTGFIRVQVMGTEE